MDTRDKRASAMGNLLFPLMPEPDGEALTQFDRQMVQGIYAGIEYTVPVLVASVCFLALPSPALAFDVGSPIAGLEFGVSSAPALAVTFASAPALSADFDGGAAVNFDAAPGDPVLDMAVEGKPSLGIGSAEMTGGRLTFETSSAPALAETLEATPSLAGGISAAPKLDGEAEPLKCP